MKRLLLLFVMALMLPIALAAPSLDYSPNPVTAGVNQQYTITLIAEDAGGIDSIWYRSPSGDQKIKMCFGDTQCIADKSFVQETAGSYTHTFYAVLSTNNQGPTVQVPVTIQSQATAAQQPEEPQTTSTFSAPGAQSNTDPGSATVTLIGSPFVDRAFTLNIEAEDDDGLDTIWFLNPKTQAYEKLEMCLGAPTCFASKSITESIAGQYEYKFVIWDSAGHDKIITYKVNVAGPAAVGPTSPGTATPTTPPATPLGPNIQVTITPEQPLVGEPVIFDASQSTPRSGTISVYEWDFNGDDIIDLRTTSPVAQFIYTAPGVYTLRLAATDASGTTYYFRNIDVNQAGLPTGGTTTLDQIGLITVTVTDNGDIVSGANVNIVGPQSQATVTDTTGKAYFQVEPGCYTVTATKEGQEFENQTTCVEAGQLQEIAIGTRLASVGGLGLGWGYIIAAILVIAVVGGGVYYYMNSDQTRGEQKMKQSHSGSSGTSQPGKR